MAGTTIIVLLSAAGGVLLKELVSHVIKWTVDRAGAIGFRSSDYGFFAIATAEDGKEYVTHFDPRNKFRELEMLPLRITGDLFNDTKTPLLLSKPEVMFLHPEGPRILHHSPHIRVKGEEPAVIMVPAHGTTSVEITIHLGRDQLDEFYGSTLPVLTMSGANGRKYSFRLTATSFYGKELAAWPRRGSLPIFPGRPSGRRRLK